MKKCLILGFSRSGKASYEYLKNHYEIYVVDENVNYDMHINYIAFEEIKESLPIFDLTIRSPGFPSTHKYFSLIRMCSKYMISEVELGYHILKEKGNLIIAVTGSDGKTTTVNLISKLLDSINVKNVMLGNIGTPICEKVELLKNEVVILELSSFQLEDIYEFKPDIVVVTNFKENHLDHVNSLEYYYASKKRITLNMENGNIYSTTNKYLDNYIDIYNANNDLYMSDNAIIYLNKEILNLSDVNNRHYLLVDMCLALSVVIKLYGFNASYIEVLKKFKGLKYRQEEINYLKFKCINDSKSTTVQALMECLKSYDIDNRIIILGGIYKSIGIENIKFKKDDEILLFGKDRYLLNSLINRAKVFVDLEEIFAYLKTEDLTNKTIIFSPSCSSLDQFKNYEERGEVFKKKCEELSYESN